jgi:hypothetical protein
MEKQEKCAHPSCTCPAKAGSKFCGTYCEGEADTADIMCNCNHPACLAGAGKEHPAAKPVSERVPSRIPR